jgi:hypothetical protein
MKEHSSLNRDRFTVLPIEVWLHPIVRGLRRSSLEQYVLYRGAIQAGRSWKIPRAELAAALKVTERTVSRNNRELVEARLLGIWERRNGLLRSNNVYAWFEPGDPKAVPGNVIDPKRVTIEQRRPRHKGLARAGHTGVSLERDIQVSRSSGTPECPGPKRDKERESERDSPSKPSSVAEAPSGSPADWMAGATPCPNSITGAPRALALVDELVEGGTDDAEVVVETGGGGGDGMENTATSVSEQQLLEGEVANAACGWARSFAKARKVIKSDMEALIVQRLGWGFSSEDARSVTEQETQLPPELPEALLRDPLGAFERGPTDFWRHQAIGEVDHLIQLIRPAMRPRSRERLLWRVVARLLGRRRRSE